MTHAPEDRSADGGPAFPVSGTISLTGMSLRDYFAGQALIGLSLQAAPWPGPSPRELAVTAYSFADAMLAAAHPKEAGR